jgi:putative flippase GtrA
VTGGLGFVVDFGILFSLTEFCGVFYLISAPIAFAISILVTYLLCAGWVFDVRQVQNSHIEFVVYASIGIIGLGVNQVVIWAVVNCFGAYYIFGKLVSTFVVLVWNFSARRTILFG